MSLDAYQRAQLLNRAAAETEVRVAKQHALNFATMRDGQRQQEIQALTQERDYARQALGDAQKALEEAQGLVKEWQSAMEAWRDLAQTLRDEIKACPNHEAHAFGKDDVARNKRLLNTEDNARVKRGLKPRYAPDQK